MTLQMWLIVCTISREYAVVNEKDVISGNVTCGSRVKVLITGIEKEVTVIFIGKNRTQCDQYCRRLSRYCGPTESSEQSVNIAFLNNPIPQKSPKISGDDVLSECSATPTELLFETNETKEELSHELREGVNKSCRILEASAENVSVRDDDVEPSTSSEQDNDKDSEDVNVDVPHLFFMELLRTMKNLRNECRSRFDRLDDQLGDLACRVSAIEELMQRSSTRSMPLSPNDASSSIPTQTSNGESTINMIFGSSPSGQNSKLQYPYPHLSEMDVDMIQRETKTVTSFARRIDRILFANDSDKDSPIDVRKDKAKTMWLKMLIRTLHPTANDLDDAARWAACREAINDYCRRSGKHLSESERVHLLQLVANRSHEEAAAEFNRLHPDREPIRQSSVSRLIAKFKETGSIMDRPRCGRPRRSTDDVRAATILAKFRENPEKSLRQMAFETGMSRNYCKGGKMCHY
ncbi:hypothetical protein DICVIV_02640 [Dictyocaulus viviparus]|uniref:DUF4817 domain-containing protein n=1 Tax=Dictyocaulus viviparus TaxID=29172 RepID=A0A0D8Y2V8_DICVI|nr:hypothetical protein DICVIV_02640 [Dictyocaulus viviparus]